MVVEIGKLKVEFHQVNHKIGATIIKPDGTKDYDEYETIKEALNRAKEILRMR